MEKLRMVKLLEEQEVLNKELKQIKDKISVIKRELNTDPVSMHYMQRFNNRLIGFSFVDLNTMKITLSGSDLRGIPKTTYGPALKGNRFKLIKIEFNDEDNIDLFYQIYRLFGNAPIAAHVPSQS